MSLAGAAVAVGNVATFDYTETAADGSTVVSEDLTYTVAGTTTFNGNSAREVDITAVGDTSTAIKEYRGFDANGNLDFFGEVTPTSDDGPAAETDTFNPYRVDLPASLTYGTSVTTTDTDTEVDTDNSGTVTQTVTTDESDVASLVSATPVTVTVPAGTFTNAYEVQVTKTDTEGDDSVQVGDTWYVPGIGPVKITGDNETDGNSELYELTSDNAARDTLAFTTQPANAAAGATIAPAVTVAMENSSGDVDTNATGSITVALGTSTGTGALSGTLTEPVVNGVATFSDLSINQGGNYTLSAASANATGSATSNAFQIGSGDHLVITNQPTGSKLNAPIPLTVAVEGDSNAIDASATGTINLTLNTVEGGDGAALGGTVSATLKDGVATFSGDDAPKVNVNGTYTLTADQTVNGSSIDSIDSDEFSVGSDTLRFSLETPKTVDPDAPISFALEALNSEKKVDTDYDGEVEVSLNVIKGDSGTTLGGTVTGDFVDGVATFKGDDAPTIAQSGTYTLTMTPVTEDESGQLEPASNVEPITSRPIVVSKLHLQFIAQPEDTNINAPIQFKVALEDASHKIVTDDTTDRVYTSGIESLGDEPPIHFQALSTLLVDGIANFDASDAYTLKLSSTGTFKIEVAESDSDDADITTTTPAISDKFKVLGFHLAFKTQPQTTPAGQPISFSVEILNSLDDLVTTEDANDIDLTRFSLVAGTGVPGGTFTVPPAPLIDGIATFAIGPDQATLDSTPGLYRLTVQEIFDSGSTAGTIVPYTKGANSKLFKITAFSRSARHSKTFFA